MLERLSEDVDSLCRAPGSHQCKAKVVGILRAFFVQLAGALEVGDGRVRLAEVHGEDAQLIVGLRHAPVASGQLLKHDLGILSEADLPQRTRMQHGELR